MLLNVPATSTSDRGCEAYWCVESACSRGSLRSSILPLDEEVQYPDIPGPCPSPIEEICPTHRTIRLDLLDFTHLPSNARLSRRGGAISDSDHLLHRFSEYWKAMRREHRGRLWKVALSMDDGRAAVKVLPPLQKIPTMWSPLLRRLRWLKYHRKSEWKPVLHNMRASFPHGQMTLILGPAGSGRTTLLKMLAGRLGLSKAWQCSGLYINAQDINIVQQRLPLCFSLVGDNDVHLPTLTVRQTLTFAFRCKAHRVDDGATDEAEHVQMVLQVLGLEHVADTVVGDHTLRGISGGERRRVTVGEMWASSVRVLVADRLTDGLDTASAEDVIRALSVWCKVMDTTVVLSLEQVPPPLYKHFDNLCVLEQGSVVYNGPVQGGADVLEKFGYEPPPPIEPTLRRPTGTPKRGRQDGGLTDGVINAEDASNRADDEPESDFRKFGRSWWTHLKLCIARQSRLEHCNVGLMVGRVLLNLLTGVSRSDRSCLVLMRTAKGIPWGFGSSAQEREGVPNLFRVSCRQALRRCRPGGPCTASAYLPCLSYFLEREGEFDRKFGTLEFGPAECGRMRWRMRDATFSHERNGPKARKASEVQLTPHPCLQRQISVGWLPMPRSAGLLRGACWEQLEWLGPWASRSLSNSDVLDGGHES